MTTTDPLDTSGGIPYDELGRRRAECPVAQTASGAWYLARHGDVLAATKDVEAFQASFREPGVVVPPEEQLVSEIPEPRHGKIRRIINSAIAQHRIGRVEPYARDLCNRLLEKKPDRPCLLMHKATVQMTLREMDACRETVAHLLKVAPGNPGGCAIGALLDCQEGKAEEARRLLLLLGRDKFDQPSAKVQSALDSVTDVNRLEELALRVHHADSWESLLGMTASARRRKRPS